MMTWEKTYRIAQPDFAEETGSTLVEVMVAMALLLAVALPAGMFLGYMASHPVNGQKIEALGMAHTAMEEMLQNNTFVPGTKVEERSDGWIMEKEQSIKTGWIYLRVTVYRQERELVSLKTARLNEAGLDNE